MYKTTEYNREFWNAARAKRRIPHTDVLESGRDTQNGSYRLPYESNKKFEALRQKENLFRRIGKLQYLLSSALMAYPTILFRHGLYLLRLYQSHLICSDICTSTFLPKF